MLLDFREAYDADGTTYGRLAGMLGGRGVPSIDEALRELYLEPLHAPFGALVNAATFTELAAARTADTTEVTTMLDTIEQKATTVLEAVKRWTNGTGDPAAVATTIRKEVATALNLTTDAPATDKASAYVRSKLGDDDTATWNTLWAWIFTHHLGDVVAATDGATESRNGIDEWLLPRVVRRAFTDSGMDEGAASSAIALIKALTSQSGILSGTASEPVDVASVLETLFEDQDVQHYVQVNRYQDDVYFNQEAFDRLLWWLAVADAVHANERSGTRGTHRTDRSIARGCGDRTTSIGKALKGCRSA